MKKLILTIFLILSLSFPLSSLDILQLAFEKEGKIPLRGIEVSIFYDERGIPKISIAQVIYGGNYKLRKEYVAPPFLLGRVIIDDKNKKYDFDPRQRRLTISPSGFLVDSKAIKKRMELIEKNYRLVKEGIGNVAGRKAVIISLESKYTNFTVIRLWIDSENYIILRRDKYNSDGRLISQTFYAEIKYGNNFSDILFKIDPSWRFHVVIDETDLKDIKDLDVPLELPFGYVLEKSYMISKNEFLTYYHRYTDGLNTISFFKSMVPLKEFGMLEVFGSFKGLFDETLLWKSFMWRDDNWTYIFIGDVPKNKIEIFLKRIFP